ncbi:hypothetical protein [Nonomuraea endophytica]|uniref:Gram-positive cocci surface proteins LPxTG domain-containing protein n=1 Tax=Nonomuraea endophytica TaxID=714136 RepID=A0A7W7ZVK8_9ACTN|nr:hypothetical protein [Nonomuraea endophytica]MBB5074632.1 hypothetical protein [Nonomuraea endophytica]
MRFNKSLAAAGALGLAVLTASPALADTPTDLPVAPVETSSPEAPVETPKPSDKPSSKPSEKPSEKPSDKPAPKPSEKPSAKPSAKASEKEVEQKGSITLSSTTAKPGETITVSVTSTREAIKAITSRGFNPPSWNVPGDRTEYRFQVRVSETPGQYPVDAHFAGGSSARAILTVEKPAAAKTSITVDRATAQPGDIVNVTVKSDGPDVKAITSRAFSPGSWNVPAGYKEYRFQVRVSGELGEHPVDAHFADGSYARTTLTVEKSAEVKYGIAVSPSAAEPGDKVSYTVTGKAADAYIESPAFWAKITENMTLGTTRTGTVPIRPDAKPGVYPVDVVFKDAAGRTVGTASTSITVKGPVKPVPVTGLELDLSPSKIVAGQTYYAAVTTTNVKAGTPVTITDPAGRKHVVRVDAWGEAHVKLTSPKGTRPGGYTVRASLDSGQSTSARLTVVKRHPQTQLALILDPDKVHAGGKFTAIVATSSFGKTTKATITDPSGKRFTVKVGKSGVGAKKFHVPSSTRAGTYWFKAKLANGATDWAKLTVKPRYRASGFTLTPKGGADTGGGLPQGNANYSEVALGGMLIAGGAGSALFVRRRTDEA